MNTTAGVYYGKLLHHEKMKIHWCKDCKKYFGHALFKNYCHFCTSKSVVTIKLKDNQPSPMFYCNDRKEWGVPCEKVSDHEDST